MPAIAFLTGDARLARHDNHERLPKAFANHGWAVACLPQEAVTLTPNGVRLGHRDPAEFDLIWPLGMGRATTFLDRMQLLRLLPQDRFVVPADALTYWHAKYAWWRHMPETFASGDPALLKRQLAQGGDWVLKPSAGSYGREVRRVGSGAAGEAAIDQLLDQGGFCLLQRYVAEAARGEKRTLVAGGRLIGSYLRRPQADLRSNLAAGGTAHATSLSDRERALVQTLAADLTQRGVGFAAVDIAYPYLMEVNLANPGGLATLETLWGRDPSADVVAAIAEWWRGAG